MNLSKWPLLFAVAALAISWLILHFLIAASPYSTVQQGASNMDPTIMEGDIAVVTSTNEYAANDIILLEGLNGPDFITRIISIDESAQRIQAQADNNAGQIPAEQNPPISRVKGKVIFHTNGFIWFFAIMIVRVLLAIPLYFLMTKFIKIKS